MAEPTFGINSTNELARRDPWSRDEICRVWELNGIDYNCPNPLITLHVYLQPRWLRAGDIFVGAQRVAQTRSYVGPLKFHVRPAPESDFERRMRFLQSERLEASIHDWMKNPDCGPKPKSIHSRMLFEYESVAEAFLAVDSAFQEFKYLRNRHVLNIDESAPLPKLVSLWLVTPKCRVRFSFTFSFRQTSVQSR